MSDIMPPPICKARNHAGGLITGYSQYYSVDNILEAETLFVTLVVFI